MKDHQTWSWALAQILAGKLREIHLHPYKIEGEPSVEVHRHSFGKRELVVMQFYIVPE